MSGRRELGTPVLRLALYYATLGLAAWLIVRSFPALADLLARFHELPASRSLEAAAAAASLSQLEWVALTLVAMLSAIALALPVAWVYMHTKRSAGYDESVVQTVIILPMTVAGTVILVRNSLALAFALAAVIAAVRFRNTLKDTKDAVYIFMAIAIGVAAGVIVPAVAAVMSALFNLVVLVLWASNVGNIYADRLGSARAERLGPILDASSQEKAKKRFNGALLVRTTNPVAAQQAAEALLEERTSRWKFAGTARTTNAGDGVKTLEYLIRIKDEALVDPLLEAIKDRGAPHIVGTDFRSLRGLDQE
jgi:hypothetical protein